MKVLLIVQSLPEVVGAGAVTVVEEVVVFQSDVGKTQYQNPVRRLPHVESMDGLMASKSPRLMLLLTDTSWQ